MTGEPSYTIDDPRPYAEQSPYTFFLPSAEELAALAPGDLAKLIFRPRQERRKWDAERMWVTIERVDGEKFEGRLDNDPEDIPGLQLGDPVTFRAHEVIACWWDEARESEPPSPPVRREYSERCFVDRCLLEDRLKVHFLYREPPETIEEDEEHEDSGWRIRADYRDVSDEEVDERAADYVALASVLNVDDSWLHLIDAPVGSRFIRDWESGEFVPERAADG